MSSSAAAAIWRLLQTDRPDLPLPDAVFAVLRGPQEAGSSCVPSLSWSRMEVSEKLHVLKRMSSARL